MEIMIGLLALCGVPTLLWFMVIWPFLQSHLAGWQDLAKKYRGPNAVEGYCFYGGGYMGGLPNFVRLCFTDTGLGISPFPLFRISRPPLFIPWSDITVQAERRIFLDKYLQLTIGDPQPTEMLLNYVNFYGRFAHLPLPFQRDVVENVGDVF